MCLLVFVPHCHWVELRCTLISSAVRKPRSQSAPRNQLPIEDLLVALWGSPVGWRVGGGTSEPSPTIPRPARECDFTQRGRGGISPPSPAPGALALIDLCRADYLI